MMTIFSSFLTGSPSFLSHWPTSTSVMDSPTAGTFNSINIFSTFLGAVDAVRILTEGGRDELFLLLFVAVGRTGGRAGGSGPADAGQRPTRQKHVAKTHAQTAPGSHVFRFVLHPDDRRAVGVLGQRLLQDSVGHWIKLFESQNGGVVAFQFLARLFEFVINFSAAQQNAPGLFRSHQRIGNNS